MSWGFSILVTLRAGLMRRIRPLRTRPGPISIKFVIPWEAIYSTHLTHWTGAVICWAKFIRICSASAWGWAVTLLRTGTVDGLIKTSFKDPLNLVAAEDINEE